MTFAGRHAARAMAAIVACIAALVGLVHLDAGFVPLPHSLTEGVDELGRADAAVLVFSLLRFVAIAICAYLAVTTSLGFLARLANWPRAIRLLDACSVPMVRRLLRGVATAGLVATLGGALGAPAALAQTAAPAPILHRLPDVDEPPPPTSPPDTSLPESSTTAPMPTVAAPPSDDGAPASPGVTMHRLDDPPPPVVGPPPVTMSAPIASTPPAPVSPDAADAAEWLIAPGDHLWHVSVATLAAAHGRPPTDAETATYLHRLIDRNRSVFAVPGDADLVFPGQRFALPPP